MGPPPESTHGTWNTKRRICNLHLATVAKSLPARCSGGPNSLTGQPTRDGRPPKMGYMGARGFFGSPGA